MSKKIKKDEFITYWIQQIDQGEKYMKKYSTLDRWKTWRQHYRGDWPDELYPVNRTFSMGRSMIPRVYFRSPRVSLTATRPEFIAHTRVVEAVDNWLIQELNLKKTIKKAILHSFNSGTAPIKLGFDSEYGFLAEQSVSGDSATATQLSTKEIKLIEYNQNIKPGLPWALPCLPEDVIIPWGYSDPDSLPWIAHKILRPLEDIKADQKYQNTSELKGSKRSSVEIKQRSPFLTGNDIQFGELIEIRDYQTQQIIVICEDTLLLKNEDVLQVGGLPYEFLTFNEDPEFFWGIADAYIIEPQQKELNEVKTQQSKHRKIALLKFLYLKGALTEDNLTALLSGDVGPGVGIDGESLAAAVSILQPHMPQELWVEAQNILRDMQEGMGFNMNQMGSYNPKGGNISATETTEVSQGVDARIDERRDIVGDLLLNIVRKWNAMIFTLWNKERVIKIAGALGEEQWIQYTGDQIKCDYTMKMDIDSGFPITGNVKRQLADGLFKTYNGDPMIDPMKLRQYHLDKYENIAPGIMSVLKNPMVTSPNPNDLLAAARQPNPEAAGSGMGSGSTPGTNRGGGQKPLNFEKFNQSMKEGK
jgi:hypothetical protein